MRTAQLFSFDYLPSAAVKVVFRRESFASSGWRSWWLSDRCGLPAGWKSSEAGRRCDRSSQSQLPMLCSWTPVLRKRLHQADFPHLNSIWITSTSRLAAFESWALPPSASLHTRGELVIQMYSTLPFLPKIHQKRRPNGEGDA